MRRLFLSLSLLPLLATAQSTDDLAPYPPAEPGDNRFVFRVPALENEADHQVEILVGQMLEVDCNLRRFSGTLEERIAEGWGFPYYVLPEVGGPASTLMACPPDDEPREMFVTVHGDGFRVRYNSQLPVVSYVPEGFQVRYRIWSAAEEVLEAQVE